MRDFPVQGLLLVAAVALAGPAVATPTRPIRSVVSDLKPAVVETETVFVVAGDNRPTGSGAPLPRVVRAIFGEVALIRPDFVLWTGDTLYGYCESAAELRAEHQAFLKEATVAGVPLFNAPGNHEIHTPQTCEDRKPEDLCAGECAVDQFRRLYGEMYGSFDYAGMHFVALASDVVGENDSITGAQLEWLKADLDANKGARAIFLFSHTEFYSSPLIEPEAGHSHPAMKNRDELHELFKKYPVKAVFSGHEHLYWREEHDGIDYFVAGGGGAPLYADPDKGGFSHYLVVRVGAGATPKPAYSLLEPGRLFTEPAAARPGRAELWVVNSNNSSLPLRGIEVSASAKLLRCEGLTVEATGPRRSDNSPGFTVASCTTRGADRKMLLATAEFPRRKSLLITLRNPQAKKPDRP